MIERGRQSTLLAYTPELTQGDYEGLSTETKPTTGADGAALPAGIKFYELDTKHTYYFDGETWRLLAPEPNVLERLDRMESLMIQQNDFMRRLVSAAELILETELK